MIELATSGQVRRTRRIKEEQLLREPSVWKEETFHFEVSMRRHDMPRCFEGTKCAFTGGIIGAIGVSTQRGRLASLPLYILALHDTREEIEDPLALISRSSRPEMKFSTYSCVIFVHSLSYRKSNCDGLP